MPTFKLNDFNPKFQEQIRRQLADEVRTVETNQPKQASAQTLDGFIPKRQSRSRCVVTLVSCVRRLFDDDNSIGACKPLRDAIAASLGIDDGDPRIRWQYQQLQTTGREGVLVHIEII